MHIGPDSPLQLTYCTNIHAADGWDGVFAKLRQYGPPLKARFAPDAPFGLGLRLSAREAGELLAGPIGEFRAFLHDTGLYVALLNGFPQGAFHGTPVKAAVYAPDWRDASRLAYTLSLVEVLQQLLPAGVEGGISTAPLSYKSWMPAPDEADWATIVDHLVRVAAALVRVREETGALIHLDIEPEPDCTIENTGEAIEFFTRRLLPVGAPRLAALTGLTTADAARRLLDHIRVCFDCCHFAVEYEDPLAAFDRLASSGIKIGRVQLSSALRVSPSAAHPDRAARLRDFADATYLHQVIERRGTTLTHFADLDEALDDGIPDTAEWRVHFHVPLFTRTFDGLESTQDDVRRVLAAVRTRSVTTHLEIETYTWEVLPPASRVALFESIAREYDWVLGQLRAAEPPHPG